MIKQTIRFKDSGIFYTIYKNETKPRLVMLHSFGSSGVVFDDIIPNLKKSFEVIVIDLPSHGNSQHSKNVKISDMPEIVLSIFAKENIARAHFIGVSEGSLVAQAFARVYPGRLQSLISISAYSIFYDAYKNVYSETRFTNLKLFFLKFLSFNKYKNFYIEQSARTNKGKQLFTKSAKNLKRTSSRSKKGIDRFYNLGKPKVNYSTYIVCGNDDHNFMKDAALQHEQRLPNTILEGYADAKQIVFLDNPRLFIDRVKTFIYTVSKDER